MKIVFLFFLVIAAALAAPPSSYKDATILRFDNDIGIDGYKFAYETSDGLVRQEEGSLKNAGTENEALVVKGSYSYTGDDGKVYTITFIADENGFQPLGEHLPKSP